MCMKRRSTTYVVPHRRRREGKTDYRKRTQLLKSRKPRFVVRKSANNITCQIVTYSQKGDVTVVSADSGELKKAGGWKGHGGNICAAYLTGYLCGLTATNKKTSEAILDAGLYRSTKASRIYAALKGALDAGLKIPHSEDILPDESRISGKHVEAYAAQLLSSDKERYKKLFSHYLKNNLKPEQFSQHVAEVKARLKPPI